MARTPANTAGAAADPGAERVTMTRDEINALVQTRIAQAVAGLAAGKRIEPPHRDLPNEDDAKLEAEAKLADGVAPSAIETQTGWYVHPLVGATAEQVESHLLKAEKQAKRKKAAEALDA